MSSLGVALSFLIYEVSSHSWAHCTDYRAVISGQDFQEDECNGYIRDWQSKWNSPAFAQDLGINYFGSNGAWCQSTFSSDIESMYTDDYPMATYYTGNSYRLVWPAKNHANYECFNNIPDTSMKLFYSTTPGRSSDPTTLNSDWVELHDFQDGCTAGTDGCGFQQCPSFCDDTDGAPCFGDFTISSDDFSSSGYYTFMWYWVFNGGSAAYTTCFEAYVDTSGGGSSANTPSPTSPQQSPTDSPTKAPTPPTPQPTRPPTEAGGTYPPTKSPTDAPVYTPDAVGDDYVVQVPVCYDGATYDEDTFINGANNAFSTNVVSWTVRTESVASDGQSFNITIQTFTDYGGTVTSTAYDYSTDKSLLCDSIEDEFDSGECEICTPGEIKLYTTAASSNSGSTESPQGGSSDDGYSIHGDSISKLIIAMIASIILNFL